MKQEDIGVVTVFVVFFVCLLLGMITLAVYRYNVNANHLELCHHMDNASNQLACIKMGA